MIEITPSARKYIVKKGIRALFITIKYIQGPCSDNLCKMIPKIVIYPEKPDQFQYTLIFKSFVEIYAIPPIVKTIEKYRDHVIIDKQRVRDKLKVSGISYSF